MELYLHTDSYITGWRLMAGPGDITRTVTMAAREKPDIARLIKSPPRRHEHTIPPKEREREKLLLNYLEKSGLSTDNAVPGRLRSIGHLCQVTSPL